MASVLFYLIKSARPKQTLKNLALLAPLVFSGSLFNQDRLIAAVISVAIFSLLTAAVYLFNDIIDLPSDRIHPYKKERPIAAGKLSIKTAFGAAFCLSFLSLFLAYNHNFFFFLTCTVYFVLQILYTLWLKKIEILEVIIVASGFVLRVYAGAFAINVHNSVWFLLCVISLALFLAVGKRRAELSTLQSSAGQHRKVLSRYSPELLDTYLAMFSTSAWMSYSLFTFFEPYQPIHHKFPVLIDLIAQFPLTVSGTNKWLMITVPVVIFGLMRYTHIIYKGNQASAPEKVLLTDLPLLSSVILWGLLIVLIIYGLN
ncbi:UbiA prenyltransferase family protein [Patescibacteria group bacterium]|nr:UbiA prenyltransferase family protein [Patescibacteria group bacterium]